MIPPLDTQTGFLPLGRFCCTEDEVQDRFVHSDQFAESTTRPEIWNHWMAARRWVTERIPVLAVWIGGSFLTSKLDPDDLDVAFTWNAEAYESLSDQVRAEIDPFQRGKPGAELHRLRIDSYAFFWRGILLPTPVVIREDPYFRFRGYWDDWWMRARSSPKGFPATDADMVARRGYLEVRYDTQR